MLIKFVRTVKYNGEYYPAHTPFQVEDKDLEDLKREGAIVLEDVIEHVQTQLPEDVNTEQVEDTQDEDDKEDKEDAEADKIDLASLTVVQLRELAEAKGVNVSQLTKKADIIAFLEESI